MIPLEVSGPNYRRRTTNIQQSVDDDDGDDDYNNFNLSLSDGFLSQLYQKTKTARCRKTRYVTVILLLIPLLVFIVFYSPSSTSMPIASFDQSKRESSQHQQQQQQSIVSLSNAICSGAQPMPIDGSIVIGVTGKPPKQYSQMLTGNSTILNCNDCLKQQLVSFIFGDAKKGWSPFWKNHLNEDESSLLNNWQTSTAWYTFKAPAIGKFRAWLDQEFFRMTETKKKQSSAASGGSSTSKKEAASPRFKILVFSRQQNNNIDNNSCTCSCANDFEENSGSSVWKPVAEISSSSSSIGTDLRFQAHNEGESFRLVVIHYYNSILPLSPPTDLERRFALKVLFTPHDSRLYHPPKSSSRCTVANPLVFLPEQPFRELIGSTVLLEQETVDEDLNKNNTDDERELVPNCWNATSIKDDDDRLYLPPTGAWYSLRTETAKLIRITLDEKGSKRLERPAFISVFESSDCHELFPTPCVMQLLKPGTNVSSPACVEGTYSWQHPISISSDDEDGYTSDKDDSMVLAPSPHHPVGTVMWQSKPNTIYKILVHRPFGIFGIYVQVVA